jgi:hypothetical protein
MLKSVGMSDGQSLCMCSIHNCSISEIGNGWGWHEDGEHAARLRRRVCRQALAILDDDMPRRIVDKWDRRIRGIA